MILEIKRLIQIVVLVLFLALFLEGFSQKSFNFIQKKRFADANSHFQLGDYQTALDIYNDLYIIDSLNGELNYYLAASLYALKGDANQVKKLLTQSVRNNYVKANLLLGKISHSEEQLNDAIVFYEAYKAVFDTDEVNRLIAISERAKQMIGVATQKEIKNLGKTINSVYADYVPLISADETMLIFTSRREGSTGGILDPYNHYFEDIYVSYFENGEWTAPKQISKNINTVTHDACAGLSPDGNTLVIYSTNKEMTGGDLYWSEGLPNGDWTKPKKYGNHINSGNQEASASFTPDGNTLYFSSNRPGGKGGKDLYRTVRFGNGDWSKPLNLGKDLNTPYDEDAPFIHPDGHTLYFSSKGHGTIGGYDIFQAKLNEDGNWSNPVNIGYPINTVSDDIYFVVSGDGKTGYYSSEKDEGYGNQDIYRVNLQESPKPIAKGKIVNKKGEAIKARITLYDVTKDFKKGIYLSNAKSGNFIMVVEFGEQYEILIEAEGYAEKKMKFGFENMQEGNPVLLDDIVLRKY